MTTGRRFSFLAITLLLAACHDGASDADNSKRLLARGDIAASEECLQADETGCIAVPIEDCKITPDPDYRDAEPTDRECYPCLDRDGVEFGEYCVEPIDPGEPTEECWLDRELSETETCYTCLVGCRTEPGEPGDGDASPVPVEECEVGTWSFCISDDGLTACPEYYEPVCGDDGVTYSNDCFATAADATVVHAGECDRPIPPPGDEA